MATIITLEAKFHLWMEGVHQPNTDDIRRRIIQHIFNHAIQRKRSVEIAFSAPKEDALLLYLTKQETEILKDGNSLFTEIETFRTKANELNEKCKTFSVKLDTVLDKYVNELLNESSTD